MNQMETQIHAELSKNKRGLTPNQLMTAANVKKKASKHFFTILDTMVAEGKVVKENGRFSLSNTAGLVPAIIVKISETFGFATPEEEGAADIFIPGRFLLGSMPGDKVLLEIFKGSSGGLSEGKVVKMVEESNRLFAATLSKNSGGETIVTPERYTKFPIKLDRKQQKEYPAEGKVLAQISFRGKRHFDHKAEIVDFYGENETAFTSAKAILAEQNIPTIFSEEVLEDAKRISNEPIHEKELAFRKDFRDEIIFTIDGADTKDIDDAISIKKKENGWQLGVHIADVGYYVLPNGIIDKEAYRRGTSVYYADQVIPMLPKELSNGICSLNPKVDRLAFSALIDIDEDGKMVHYSFHKSIINSCLQGVYSEINQILEGETTPELQEKYSDVMEEVFEMERLATTLYKSRMAHGGIQLESTESYIKVDDKGVAVGIELRESGKSEGFIEEFMLMANQAAATFGIEKSLPFLFRIHESPSADRLGSLYQLLDKLGIPHSNKTDNITAKDLDKILEEVKDTPLSPIVNTVVLRTMAKAKYSAENKGHFGLGIFNYSHFTSPIRRYPDLAIHRILTGLLTGMRSDTLEKRFRNWVADTAQHSSMREVAAQTAERDCEDCYKAEYMSAFIGQEFDGVIVSATAFGAFVQLPNSVDGLVGLKSFPHGEWDYDNLLSYKSRVGNRVLQVGDKVKIKVVKTDISAGQIDFIFAE